MVAATSRVSRSRRTDLRGFLAECQALVLDEIRRCVSGADRSGQPLYELMLDYPMRAAKGLRPGLCIATCRALGGGLEAVLPSAAVLELYHNAFLIHDDIEDGSEQRRDRPTMHREHGVPIAINVGDGMLALALTPLLENTRVVGLGKTLRIVDVIARMARETAEGQAIELEWVRRSAWDLDDDDYREMVVKKTGWYSFITPMTIGAIIAGVDAAQVDALSDVARELSIAFQIRDDVLNLQENTAAYGKELNGDLWEGKRTLILLHAVRRLGPADRKRARAILARPRRSEVGGLLDALERDGDLSTRGRRRIARALGDERPKTEDDVATLRRWIDAGDSIAYADAIGRGHALSAREALARVGLRPSIYHDVINALIDFTVERDH